MEIVLHPRAAPSDRLRVWIGVFQVTNAPALAWSLDGVAVEPAPLRAIASARTDDLLPASQAPEDVPRAFTGVYEFAGLQPDTLHAISVSADGIQQELSARTLPTEIPAGLDTWFNVLLVSCHHAAEDRCGLSGIIVSQLKALLKPHLTILSGDQVYLDLPTLTDFRDDERWLAEKFERDYIENWRGPDGYAHVLDAAPSVSIPDDHEYWNNFPHASPFIQNAWSNNGRERWRKAAQAMYRAFQLPYPNNLGEAFILDVPPLSFFLADTRSDKDFDLEFTMSEAEHQQLNDWVDRVIAEKRLGVFVSGQSVFEDAIGSIAGAIADYGLPNYKDFGRIMHTLQRLVDAGRPLICLTGDVHWGRIASAQDLNTGRTAITEIIASPSSLVTTVGADTIKEIGGFFHGIFGESDPWPRHSAAGQPPAFLGAGALGGRFACSTIHEQKGNHVALMSFRQGGNSVRCRVTYWPIHPDSTVRTPVELGPFKFKGA
ncbi:MAG TPA: hypothetical protein VLG74_10145 [Blastocatellia bacterium]|nr:hypothetical protein [Blastocatellia bacterium]